MSAKGQNDQVALGEILRFVARYWRRTPGSVAIIVAGISTGIMLDVALPSIAKGLVNAITSGDQNRAIRLVALFMGCGAGFTLSWQIGYRLFCKETMRHMTSIIRESYDKVQRASTDWHANTFAGSTVKQITRGMHAFDAFSDQLLSGVWATGLLVTGSLVMMWLNSPWLGLASSISLSLYLTGGVLVARHHVAPANRQAVAEDSRLSGALADAISCNHAVKTFGAEARELARLGQTVDVWQRLNLRAWLKRQDMYAIMTVLSLLNQLALLGTPVWLWSRGMASASDVAYALTAFFLLQSSIRQVVNVTESLQRAANDMEDIILFDRMVPDVADHPAAREARLNGGSVRFERVSFGYAGQAQRIYRDLSVAIAAGETVGLVGASGSGKSTFVKLLQRLYEVNGGRICLDGEDVRQLTQSSLRASIALVPQEPVLFHRSLAENIRYGRPDATDTEVEQAAREAHAHEFISRLPEGYATLVGERGIKLSGGERQRVAIARALLSRAPLLVLDEATSSLDSVSEALIQDALERLMAGRTTIIIAHRLSTLRAVDRILVFERGRVVEEGRHEELLELENGHYRRLYETQQLGLSQPELV